MPIGLRGGCAPANGEALKEHAKKQQEGAHLLVDAMRTLATRANDAIRNSIADGTVIITSRPFVPKKHNRMRTLFGSRASGLSTPLEDDHILTELDKVLRWPPGNSKSKRRNGSLWDEDRDIAVVTTASLPWMTGTAVNPLLRAAYLSQRNVRVTVVVPWLPPSDQQLVHPKQTFDVPEQQEQYVREWVKRRVGFDPQLEVRFYPSRYARDKCSIVPVGDITQSIPDSRADVAVLEEPEHLNWCGPPLHSEQDGGVGRFYAQWNMCNFLAGIIMEHGGRKSSIMSLAWFTPTTWNMRGGRAMDP